MLVWEGCYCTCFFGLSGKSDMLDRTGHISHSMEMWKMDWKLKQPAMGNFTGKSQDFKSPIGPELLGSKQTMRVRSSVSTKQKTWMDLGVLWKGGWVKNITVPHFFSGFGDLGTGNHRWKLECRTQETLGCCEGFLAILLVTFLGWWFVTPSKVVGGLQLGDKKGHGLNHLGFVSAGPKHFFSTQAEATASSFFWTPPKK